MLRKRSFVYLIALAFLVASCGGGPTTPPPKQKGSISGLLISAGTVGQNAVSEFEIIDFVKTNNLDEDNESNVIPGEYLVSFKDGISTQGLQTLNVDGHELKQISSMSFNDLTIYYYKAESVTELQSMAIRSELENSPRIDAITENRIFDMTKTPNDPGYPIQWHYPSFNLPAAWDIETGKSMVVAVVDTGIVKHPELRVLPGYDFFANDNDPTDEAGSQTQFHGTHVAGTIGIISNDGKGLAGVSWATKILPIRVLGPRGSTQQIMAGVFWAAGGTVNGVPANPNPAKIINMSLGGKGACSKLENDVFKALTDAGRIVIVAAGNDNIDVSQVSPASCDNIIVVGATGPRGQRAPYSNYGNKIDVMAPGGDVNQKITVAGKSYPTGVLSTSFDLQASQFSYSFLQGTSMASPHIAGLVALMVSQDSNLNHSAALAKLKSAGRSMSAADCKRSSGSDCGAGLVDAARALKSNSNPKPPPPPPPTTNLTTYVVAFYCTNTTNCIPYDENRSKFTVVKQDKSQVPYTLGGLEEGTYLVGGFQDINGNVEFDNGEPLGAFPNLVNLKAGQNLAGVSIVMKPFTANSQSQSGNSFDRSLNESINKLLDLEE